MNNDAASLSPTSSNSSNSRGSYDTRQDKKYWGVYWLDKANVSMAKIGGIVDMKKSTVQAIIERIRETGTPMPAHSTGRSKKLNERDERALERIVSRGDPFLSCKQILEELALHQIHISKPTLVRYLDVQGFKPSSSSVAHNKPRLTPQNIKARQRWAKERVHWTKEQWRELVWSDASRYSIESYDGAGGARVVRHVEERYNVEQVNPAVTTEWGKGHLMLWGCFWAGGCGPSCIFIKEEEDKINQDDFYADMLAQKFVPWFDNLVEKHDSDFIFQEDSGAAVHPARWWRHVPSIQRVALWPANSPDLNPMEYIWSGLDRLIEEKRDSIKSIKELENFLLEAWKRIPADFTERLVASMPNRCQAVIDAHGEITKY